MTGQDWIQVAVTAALSGLVASLLTLGLTWAVLRRAAARRFAAEKAKLEAELDAKIDDALRRLGEIMEERVRRGVVDGVSSLPSAEVVRSTSRAVARTGAELVEHGLSALLRRRPDDPAGEE